jgi:hypothetical protein
MMWLRSTWPGITARFPAVAAVAAILLLLLLPPPPLGAKAARAPAAAGTRSKCTALCGNISIPYPFGVEPGCYHDGGFNLTCDHSYSPPKLFLGDGTVQVLDVDLPNGTVRVNSSTYNFHVKSEDPTAINLTWRAGGPGYAAGGPYFLAGKGQNNLLVVGCGVQLVLLGESGTLDSACSPFCAGDASKKELAMCSGIDCCQATIYSGRASYSLQSHSLGDNPFLEYIVMVESGYHVSVDDYEISYQTVPAILGRTIRSSLCHTDGSSTSCRSKHSFCYNYTRDIYAANYSDLIPGHNCGCAGGYQGNPYISHGCYGNYTSFFIYFNAQNI